MSATWLKPGAYNYLFNASSKASRAAHLRTFLYRASKTNIWSVIPAYPDNSAPIPRAKPLKPPAGPKKSTSTKPRCHPARASKPQPPKPKPLPPPPSPTPMQECDSSTRERALLSNIIKYTQDYTVGPLDYCGIARRIKGRGPDM